jgi:diguanylate cyclase (GGDEF)-like protein/PAS domain S-box-containing protein
MRPSKGPLVGAGLTLAGVALVEILLRLGMLPFTPLGWPALGALAAAAIAGWSALAGAAAVLLPYYLLNLGHTERFPAFFDGFAPTLSWTAGLLLLGAIVMVLRARLRQAELVATYDRALRESEERFRSLTELSSDYYWEQDENLRFVSRSSGRHGNDPYPLERVLGKTRWELPALNMSEQDWTAHRAQLDARQEFRDLVICRPAADGAERWISMSGRPIFDASGRFKGYRGVARDISVQRKAERALRESEERLRVITDNVPALVAYIDAGERYRFNNRMYCDWLGPEYADISGRTVREVWGDARYALIRPNLERACRGERVSHEYTLPGETGERHLLASYVPHTDAAGAVKGYFVLASDVTQLAAARAELHAARERLEQALDGSSVALWDADLRTGRVYLSEAWAAIVGQPAGETVASLGELTAMLHPDDREMTARVSVEALKGLRPVYAAEHRVRSASGEWKWIISRGRVTDRDSSGRALRMIGTNLDITDRKRIEEALQSVAQTDPLTGLANRMLLLDHVRQAIARSARSGTKIALLYLDIDRFKQVNDSLGHATGDALLKGFAVRLRGCVRTSDTVARLGGDEFVVLLDELKEGDHALRVAENILDAMAAPIAIDGQPLKISVSIGLAVRSGTENEERFIQRADVALYEAKRAGRNTVRIAG